MRSRVDDTLLAEIRLRELRFTCRDCLYALPDAGEPVCAHAWPNQDHLHIPDGGDRGKELVFCKEFDLR